MKNKFFDREANLAMLFDILEILGFFTILGLILFFTAILADKLNLPKKQKEGIAIHGGDEFRLIS